MAFDVKQILTNFFKKKPQDPKKKKSFVREWLDAILFAGVAALIIRAFIIEAFMIPSSSMESSMLVGDFLFVSKFHYGARLPMAPLSLPFIHNRIPYTNSKSFAEGVSLPYMRLPGFSEVKRNDIVVFNYPADDISPCNKEMGPVYLTSMKENYIKRCVAVAGDTFQVIDSDVYINGKKGWNPPLRQNRYAIEVSNNNYETFFAKYRDDLWSLGIREFSQGGENSSFSAFPIRISKDTIKTIVTVSTTDSAAKILKSWSDVTKIERYKDTTLLKNANDYTKFDLFAEMKSRFPYNPAKFDWNNDFFGPLIIPKEGQTMAINMDNIDLYRRCIETYEGNTLKVENNKIFINGKEATSYTFKMNYYFMMGDNRYNSADSRVWGMTPEDHIVGKPILVFFSTERGIRWNRLLKSVD